MLNYPHTAGFTVAAVFRLPGGKIGLCEHVSAPCLSVPVSYCIFWAENIRWVMLHKLWIALLLHSLFPVHTERCTSRNPDGKRFEYPEKCNSYVPAMACKLHLTLSEDEQHHHFKLQSIYCALLLLLYFSIHSFLKKKTQNRRQRRCPWIKRHRHDSKVFSTGWNFIRKQSVTWSWYENPRFGSVERRTKQK